MEVVQRDPRYLMVLVVLSALKGSSALIETATVHLEEGMVLDCLCPWSGNLTMVIWSKESNTIAVFHPEFGAALMGNYKERVTFVRTTDMDGSISLRNVTHQDIGFYRCSIQTFPKGPWTKTFAVEDLDEPPEIDYDVDVEHEEKQEQATKRPGAEEPHVDSQVEAELGSNLTVSCDQNHNGSISQVFMERELSGLWKIIGVCKSVDGQIVTEDYSDRGQMVCTEHLDISLHLTDVASEDEGFYRCISSTDAGVQTTTVHVTVPATGWFSLNLYLMYIYIGAGAAGLVLFNVIVILTIRHKKKNRREEYRVKDHPFRKQPNTYENVLIVPTVPQRSKKIETWPIYANLHQVRAHAALT